MADRKERTRAALLEATRRLIVERPFREVTLGRVAAEAGVSRPTRLMVITA